MNNIIIITGGTSGLGLELVTEALKRGFFVCNLSRNKEKMATLESKFTNNYKGFVGDVSDATFVKNAIKEITSLGEVSTLINCADKGIFRKAAQYEASDLETSFAGLKGMILCTTEVLKAKAEKDVKIVNIMSSAALKGNKNETVYCAAKWGERGYTESLKAEYKGTSVKIVGVYQGGMNTDFWNNSRDYVSEEKAKSFMDPKDVAKVVMDNITYGGLNVSDVVIERL
ncbi:SDR family oxidoreductase [Candidatus Saccharibacteria bacterium]|nr:SDR family oxidoreductase [Candidatus Saccharibacteria bacterium]